MSVQSKERVVPQPEYGISAIMQRAKVIAEVVDPRHLFTTEQDVAKARATVKNSMSQAEVDRAQWVLDGATHFQTGEIIPWWGRLAAWPYFSGVPMATIVLQVKYRGFNVPRLAFLHWCNQSVVASVNYYNGARTTNKPTVDNEQRTSKTVTRSWSPLMSVPMLATFFEKPENEGLAKVATAYSYATTTAVGIVLGTAMLVKAVPMLTPFAQYSGFAAAGTANMANTFMMKQETLDKGVAVVNADGEEIGMSKVAAFTGVRDTAITRIGLPFLSLFIAPVILNALQATTPIGAMPRLLMAANFVVPFSMFPLGLPFTIGCLPEVMEMKAANVTDLEDEIAEKYGADWKSKDIELYYNRGR